MVEKPEAASGGAASGGVSDERLMLEFAQGSEAAFAELFARYRQAVYGFFRRRVVDRELAEELAQETFVAVLQAAGRYEATALFRTYLYAIALKKLAAERRKRAFRAAFWVGGRDVEEAAGPATAGLEVEMRQALGRLEGMDREVLLLREYEQLSYAEIAEVLGIPVNTVRSRLFRARAALREVLAVRVRETGAGFAVRVEEQA